MTTCDAIRPTLSEYVDRHLDVAQADLVRTHLSTCAACRGVADDLDRVRGLARSLGPVTPPAHLWLEIAGRVRLEGGGAPSDPPIPQLSRPSGSRGEVWQWVGLAAALLIATLGMYSIAQPGATTTGSTPTVADSGNATEVPTVETVEETMRRAEAEYEKAIAQLEQIVTKGDTTVSSATVATLQRNLATIDTAIAETRAALTVDPNSQPARTSLFEALRNKVNVLQHTVVLMNEMRKGDATGAAEAASGFVKRPS